MAGIPEGFGYDDFAANNPPAGIDPSSWRASIYSKRDASSLETDHEDTTGKQRSFLYSVAKGTMAVGKYYDSVTEEYPKTAAFMQKAGIIAGPTVAGLLAPVPGSAAIGFGVGVGSLLKSEIIDLAAGDQIAAGLEKLRDVGSNFLMNEFDLSKPEANSLVGAGLFMGGSALGLRDNIKFASSLKMKLREQHNARQTEGSSVLFKKSFDDTGISLKSKDYAASLKSDFDLGEGYHPKGLRAYKLYKQSLAKEEQNSLLHIASKKQMDELYAGKYTTIAGYGSRTSLDDAPRLVSHYGGEIKDWIKIVSDSYTVNKSKISIHAYKNEKTGAIFEMKTKLD